MLSSPRCSNESLPLLVRVVEWSSYKDEFLTGGLRENLKVAVQEKGRAIIVLCAPLDVQDRP